MEKPTAKHIKIKKTFSIISIIVFIAFIIIGGIVLWDFIKNFEDPVQFKEYIDSFGSIGIVVVIVIQILQIIFPLIPGEIIELGAGYTHGAILGFILCEIGLLVASLGIFFLVRRFGKKILIIFGKEESFNNMRFLQNEKNVFGVLFFLFLIPGTPKDIMTYFMGLTKISTPQFLLITTVARIPSIISSTIIGASISRQDYKLSLIVFIITTVFSIGGFFIYQHYTKKKAKKA